MAPVQQVCVQRRPLSLSALILQQGKILRSIFPLNYSGTAIRDARKNRLVEHLDKRLPVLLSHKKCDERDEHLVADKFEEVLISLAVYASKSVRQIVPLKEVSEPAD